MSTSTRGGSSGQGLFRFPDESFQSVEQDGRLVVLTVEDSLTIRDEGPVPADLTRYTEARVYAEDTVLATTLKAQDCYLSLHALTAVAGAGIDVSGAEGKPGGPATEVPGKPAAEGQPGLHGNALVVLLGSADAAPPPLMLTATGGDGGKGQDNLSSTAGSAGGRGGDAGNGGTVFVAARQIFRVWLDGLRQIFRARASTDARSAVATFADLVNARPDAAQAIPVANGATLKDVAGQLGALVATWDDSSMAEARLLAEPVALLLQSRVLAWQTGIIGKVDVSAGDYGPYGAGLANGDNGLAGSPGVRTVTTFSDAGQLPSLGLDDLLFAHPEQCTMLLQKAQLRYFTAHPVQNPDAIRDTAAMLDRLIERTGDFPSLTGDAPLLQAYNDLDNQRALGSGDCVGTLINVFRSASVLRQQLRQGLDSFGHPYDFAPLASYDFYSSQLEQMMDAFQSVESSYQAYFTAEEETKEREAALQQSLTSAKQARESARNDIDQLFGQATRVLTVIRSYEPTLQAQRDEVVRKLERFKEKLEKHFDLELKDLFSAIATVAFAPESPWMWATQGASTLYKFDTEIVTDDGQSIPKDYLVSHVASVDGSLQSIVEGYKALPDGTLSEDDDGAALLIANQQALSKTLDSVYSKFPDEADALKTAFQTYVDSVVARNNQILDYNAIVLLLARKQQVVEELEGRIDTIGQQLLQGYQPNLPLMTSFMSRLYQQSREQILETLYLTTRAFQFWAVTDDNLLTEALDGNAVPAIDAGVLQAARIAILRRYQTAVESFGHGAQPYPDPRQPSQPGVQVQLTGLQLDQLRRSGRLLLSIPAAYKNSLKQDNPFADFANVRVTKVRLWADGVTTSDGQLHIRITHTGNETVVSQHNQGYRFSHDPVTLLFIYGLADKTPIEDGDFNYQPAGTQQSYALLGPFTWWQIEIPEENNVGLDLSGLTSATLELHITNYTFV
ncbi:hypothetical protein [Sorangium sp. So ce385]|uniref:hypothetical protein n=1 Tax=Sorangium sp. So ce385 TaxID=3133308 RepID=UPI003F5C36B9